MPKKLTKERVFIFAQDHGLSTAMAMHEDGNVLYSHGGSDYYDAVSWLYYHHPDLKEKYECIEPDKDLIKAYFYEKANILTLGVDFQLALTKNKEIGEKAKQAEKH